MASYIFKGVKAWDITVSLIVALGNPRPLENQLHMLRMFFVDTKNDRIEDIRQQLDIVYYTLCDTGERDMAKWIEPWVTEDVKSAVGIWEGA